MNRRVFARTATDISIHEFVSSEQAVAPVFLNERSSPVALNSGGPVHVVPYLTPHKVSVLTLIEYYCQSQCPQALGQSLLLFLLKRIQVRPNTCSID
jgi:hypothetical protein